MSLIGSIFNFIKAIVKSVIKIIADIFKKYWWIILIVVCLYFFGPFLLEYMASAGAPGWLLTATSTIIDGAYWLVNGAVALFSAGWGALSASAAGWSLSTWATVVSGVGMLLAPEETADLIGDIVDTTLPVVGGVVSALFRNPWVLGALGVGLYLWLKPSSDESAEAT